MNVGHPKIMIAFASGFDIRQPLRYQLVRAKVIEPQATLRRLLKVTIVGGVAEHAGCHDVFEVVAAGLSLRQKVVPGQR